MNTSLRLIQVIFFCALIVLLKMIFQAAPILLIPFLIVILLGFKWHGQVHFYDDDPADWWKKEIKDE